jgi:hypothetical protein
MKCGDERLMISWRRIKKFTSNFFYREFYFKFFEIKKTNRVFLLIS